MAFCSYINNFCKIIFGKGQKEIELPEPQNDNRKRKPSIFGINYEQNEKRTKKKKLKNKKRKPKALTKQASFLDKPKALVRKASKIRRKQTSWVPVSSLTSLEHGSSSENENSTEHGDNPKRKITRTESNLVYSVEPTTSDPFKSKPKAKYEPNLKYVIFIPTVGIPTEESEKELQNKKVIQHQDPDSDEDSEESSDSVDTNLEESQDLAQPTKPSNNQEVSQPKDLDPDLDEDSDIDEDSENISASVDTNLEETRDLAQPSKPPGFFSKLFCHKRKAST